MYRTLHQLLQVLRYPVRHMERLIGAMEVRSVDLSGICGFSRVPSLRDLSEGPRGSAPIAFKRRSDRERLPQLAATFRLPVIVLCPCAYRCRLCGGIIPHPDRGFQPPSAMILVFSENIPPGPALFSYAGPSWFRALWPQSAFPRFPTLSFMKALSFMKSLKRRLRLVRMTRR